MSAKATYSTPMLHAMDIERSLAFYELLGFVTVNTNGGKPLGWARAHCEGGALMFLRAAHPVDPAVQGVMLYMYSPDLLAHTLNCRGAASPRRLSATRATCPAGRCNCETRMAIPSSLYTGDQTSRTPGSSA